jgi:hypothetical protein
VACGICVPCAGHPLQRTYAQLFLKMKNPPHAAQRELGNVSESLRQAALEARQAALEVTAAQKARKLARSRGSRRREPSVEELNTWVDAAVAALNNHSELGPTLVAQLTRRAQELGRFANTTLNLPPSVSALPVLYPFSGIDLITAHALFPRAPSFTLAADLPAGRPWCLGSPRCAAAALSSVIDFFLHVTRYRFAWTSTTHMLSIVSRGFLVGVEPILLVCLRLLGHRPERVTRVVETTSPAVPRGEGVPYRQLAVQSTSALSIESAHGGPRVTERARTHTTTMDGKRARNSTARRPILSLLACNG